MGEGRALIRRFQSDDLPVLLEIGRSTWRESEQLNKQAYGEDLYKLLPQEIDEEIGDGTAPVGSSFFSFDTNMGSFRQVFKLFDASFFFKIQIYRGPSESMERDMEELDTLVKQAQTGDLDAFGTVVRRFQDMAVGYAYAQLGDFHLAEDAAQEAFLAAYLSLPQLREPSAFPGWFRRVVSTHANRVARGKHIPTVELDRALEVASEEKGPDERLDEQDLKAHVLAAIQTLPAQCFENPAREVLHAIERCFFRCAGYGSHGGYSVREPVYLRSVHRVGFQPLPYTPFYDEADGRPDQFRSFPNAGFCAARSSIRQPGVGLERRSEYADSRRLETPESDCARHYGAPGGHLAARSGRGDERRRMGDQHRGAQGPPGILERSVPSAVRRAGGRAD